MPQKTIQSGQDPAVDIAALREQIQTDRQAGHSAAATAGLRRLRRLAELKPNEHRQLFRILRRTGRSGLVDRYLGMVRRAVPDAGNWNRVCLALWSEAQLDRLFNWASHHPDGPEAAGRTLLALARVSRKFGEVVTADLIEARTDAWIRTGYRQERDAAPAEAGPVAPRPGRPRGRAVERQARQLAEEHRLEEAWALADGDLSLRIRVAVLRGLYASGQYAAQLEGTLGLFDHLWPFDGIEPEVALQIVAAGRLLLRRGILAHVFARPPEAWLADHPDAPTPLAAWVRAMVLASMLRRNEALDAMQQALAGEPKCPVSGLDFNAEVGGIYMLYNDLGAARPAFAMASEAGRKDHAGAVERLDQVSALCGPEPHFPECLVDVIFAELGRGGPIGYDPEPGHLATVTGTLAQGGGERQTANVIAAMAGQAAVRRQTVLVRSIEGDHAFFLPIVEAAGAEIVVYGKAFRERSDIDQLTPELASRPRLRAAIDLLPLRHREEVLRLLRHILDRRPAVVHVRQDLTESALACAIAGTPRFCIHRGSLARNTWDVTPLQIETINRPMRHLYRRLLTDSDFFLINNSGAGLASDQAWLDLSGPDKFHVVHNVFDFDSLGPAEGPNPALRASLGITPDDPVIGGVFRMAGVKRPLLWLETAYRVLQGLPNARFILVGDDGDLGQAVRDRAAQLGMADRLHMPGAVRNVGDWYRAFDVLLLTSEREGLPNVTIEAQHFGVPVVATDVGGTAETVQAGVTGILVAGADPADSLARGVLQALTDVEWRRRAVETAPAFVHDKFGGSQTRSDLLGLFGLT